MQKIRQETFEKSKENRTRKKDGKAIWLIILCWLVYACSYIGKLGYNANIVQIESFFDVSHAQAGSVSTFFFFTYGAGQIFNGIFCKKYNVKYTVFGVLIASATCNVLVGTLSDFTAIKYVWLVNGAALSVLWPSLIRLLSETLDPKDMSKAVVWMGTTVATGTFLVYGLSALFVQLNVFKTIFYVAAALMPMIAVVWLLFCPKQKGGVSKISEEKPKPTAGKMPKELWLPVCLLALFAVVTNITKDGLTTWVPSILKELYRLEDSLSILLTLFLPVLAIFGTAVVIRLHKKISDFVLLCSVIFFTTTILIGLVIVFLSAGAAVTLICFSLVSCLMAGANNVITSMAPLYWKEKVNSGMLAGVLNGFCYIGSTLSSYGLGTIADFGGWEAVFWLLLGLCALCVLIGSVYFVCKYVKNRKNRREF